MERHPIPRHISGYQFRLIGDMTLKQFVELAAGGVMAVISWYLPTSVLIRYPLTIFFAALGVALAFVPINERPLDSWILAFFRAVYSPTQYLWEKEAVTASFFQKVVSPREAVKIVKGDRQKLEKYLKKKEETAPPSPLEEEEQKRLQAINTLFQAIGLPSPPPAIPSLFPTPPKIEGIKIRRLKEVKVPPTEPVKVEKKLKKAAPKKKVKKKPVKKEKKKIPQPEEIKIPQFKRAPRPTTRPRFEPKLPFPQPPSQPNILVGMVLSREGKILPDVIIEIRDEKGFPVRALKSNKLGQFRIATPLKNGVYEIELEKEGQKFPIIKFEAEGKIIEPLEIRAK